MDRKFSIGEFSKLHNVSIQTLRHYDKIGLLKPTYINEKTNYRYYSIDSFIMLAFIKQCKVIGLSLEDIKTLVDNYTSINSIMNIITKQKEIVIHRLKELEIIMDNINILENKVQTVLVQGTRKPFIKKYSERSYLKYNNVKRYTDEFEIRLTEKLSTIEEKHGPVYKELAFSVPYDTFKKKRELNYDHMMLSFNEGILEDAEEKIILPEGDYVTIYFDDDYRNTTPYYELLLNYIESNNLNVGKSFYESYIMTCISKDDVKSLGQIQIQLLQ